jgi:hypothetical protein
MKIHREGFLAAAMAIAAANAIGCKAKIGDDATPENASPTAEGIGAPTQEGAAVNNNRGAPPPGAAPIFNRPIGPLNGPAQETAPAGWGAPPTPAPAATQPNGWAAPAATQQPPPNGWAAPKPAPTPAPANTSGWAHPKPAPTPAPKSGWTQPKSP